MTPPVTVITTNAGSADTLTDQDYRDIYDELRQKCPLRQFAEAIHSAVSFAWWNKYERGEAVLNRERRNELRAAVGLPALPATVAEACATADLDATVYQVGASPADRLILIGADAHDPLDLHINGNLAVIDAPASVGANDHSPLPAQPAQQSHVTPVTAPKRRAMTKAVRFSPERWERLSLLRKEADMTWDEFADWLLTLCGA